MLRMTLLAAGCMAMAAGASGAPLYEAALIFEPGPETPGHVHASCIVEAPNGDLLAVWYENGPALPPPYCSGDRDKSDDVRIGGSRKPAGAAAWEAPFVAADTYGVSDNNPCLVIDRDARLWLFHAVLLGVPEVAWESALIRYHISTDYSRPGPPQWDAENLLVVHPVGFEEAYLGNLSKRRTLSESQREAGLKVAQKRLKDPYKTRLGWMPRAHPIIRSDGALLLPLANENYGFAAMAITPDGGASWTIGAAVPGGSLEQPTVVEYPDKTMTAFFRNSRPEKRILRSESADGGMTWSPLAVTDLPHPNAGFEAILLQDGRLLMIYNDSESERDTLAVSLSEDRGKTWQHTRHLEATPGERFDYPSIVQGKDGTLHAAYSYNTKTIKYAHFNLEWVMAGDR